MEEVAPEYDVVVLGTGTTPPPIPLAKEGLERLMLMLALDRIDRMRSFWVYIYF